ncbi:helix-turn-helix domain-containing protein [Sulfurovum sp. bin170]|uniref:helix-turn-helix domain-containing protein n=1 Tax=Sulfurovum sp. bin170 TaxID=2695268 RepID=UPI0013DEFA3F|nr:helix-turn-helix domain-containing protein [Sulfurovum sp. bin170]NEW60867.1 helix-turn-helix domain-containing protein [Sulfurovum sp. bin170]
MGNIIKETAKELGMTQKQMAKYIGVSEETVSKWSRGVIETPKWALKMFDLIKREKQYKSLEEDLDEVINKVNDIKTTYSLLFSEKSLDKS